MKTHGMIRQGIAGTGRIAGKYNPLVADDVTINAKKGEYILSPEDVALLGGPEVLDAMIQKIRAAAGQPTRTGPKTHGQPDRFGRRDTPGLKGIAGLADGGNTDWKPPYETDLGELASAHPIANVVGLGVPALSQKIAGGIGNVISAMSTPTDPMALVKGRTQQVADQLGAISKNISLPAAVATQVVTGQPVVGNKPVPATSITTPSKVTTASGTKTVAPQPGSGSLNAKPIADGSLPPRIAPGMESIAQTAVNVGLPASGSSIGKSIAGPSVQLDGSKGLGNTTAISNRVDWSPRSANYQTALADANRKNGLMTDSNAPGGVRLMTVGEADSLGLTTPQQRLARNNQDIQDQMRTIAGNMGNDYNGAQNIAAARMKIAALQGMNSQLLQGIAGDQALEGHKYAADQGLTGQKYAADAGVMSHGIAGNTAIKVAEIGADAKKVEAERAQRKDAAKKFDDRVKGFFGAKFPDGTPLNQDHAKQAALYSHLIDNGASTLSFGKGNYVVSDQAVNAAHQALTRKLGRRATTQELQGYLANNIDVLIQNGLAASSQYANVIPAKADTTNLQPIAEQ